MLENSIECLRDSILNSKESKEFLSIFEKKRKEEIVTFNSTIDSKRFIELMIPALEALGHRVEKVEGLYNYNMYEVKKLANYNLINNRDLVLWKEKINKMKK